MPSADVVHAVLGVLGVMAMARDAFGPGTAATAALPPSPASTALRTNSGQAAQASVDESQVLTRHVATLDTYDQHTHGQLADAVAQARAGRDGMNAAICGWIADANEFMARASHPEGVIALMNAMGDRLQETRDALTGAHNDSHERAAQSVQTASAYHAVPAAGVAPTASISPMAELVAMQTASMMASAPMSASAAPLSALSQMERFAPQADNLSTLHTFMTRPDAPNPTPISGVSFDREGFTKGRDAYREYVAQALDAEGITDPTARYNWTSGLMVGAERESSFDPLAVNTSDSNATGVEAADGAPANCSRGVLQTVPGTFKTYHQHGTSNNIYDPVANTAAAMNYLMEHYHVQPDGSNLSAVGQFNPNHAPGGY